MISKVAKTTVHNDVAHTHGGGFGECTLLLKIAKHYEAPSMWEVCFPSNMKKCDTLLSFPLSQVTSTLSRNKQKIASSKSLIIEKDKMRGDFHGIMDIHSDETQEFATTLFDTRGQLNKEVRK